MFSFLKSLLGMAAPYRVRLALGIVFGILGGLIEPLMIATVMFVYSVVFQDLGDAEAQIWWRKLPEFAREGMTRLIEAQNDPARRHGVLLVGLIPLVFTLRGVIGYLNAYLLQWVAMRTITDLRVRLFEHLLALPASFFAASRTGDLMSRVMADTEAMRMTISISLTTLIKDPVTLVTMLGFLLLTQAKLTLIALTVFPLCIVPIAIYSRKARRAAAATQERYSDIYHRMLESFMGQRILKAYNLEQAVTRDFRAAANRFMSDFMRMIRATEISGPMLEVAGSIGFALLLYYLMSQPTRPDSSGFLALVMALLTLYRPIKSLVRVHATLEQARAGHNRVCALLDTRSPLLEPAQPRPLKAAGADITFENIDFSYGEKPVLVGVNLRVPAGKLVALVGSSGSGKTTVTNLLLRFYDPNSGTIRIGGVDIRDVATRDLRGQIAVVTQETILFNDTIRNNIALGRPGASEADIIVAARHAHAHDFITEKPEGYNTLIGERGVALSGGQRQRLAIARAILKDAPILILDEATSALDTESERIVQAALEELMIGRTTICIAHRLSTIQRADIIVVMSEGRIVETGTHNELLARGGVYKNLHNMQFNTPS